MPRLVELELPTLVLHGRHDFIPLTLAQRIAEDPAARAIRRSRLRPLRLPRGAGRVRRAHCVTLEHFRRVATMTAGMSDNPLMQEDELRDRVRESEEQLEDAEKRLEEVAEQIDEAREHADDGD